MSFYGNIWLNNEILEEQEILQEMNFTKKDLQDPKTIEKIIKKKEQFESVTKFLSYLFLALFTVCSISTATIMTSTGITGPVVGIIFGSSVFGFIFSNINECVKALPATVFKKNNEKYKSKCTSLIKKMETNIVKYYKNKEITVSKWNLNRVSSAK